MTIDLDAGRIFRDGFALEIAASAIDRREHARVDLALGDGAGVAGAIRRSVPLGAHGRDHDDRGGEPAKQRKSG